MRLTILNKIRKTGSNKVLLYLFSRYTTFAIQLFSSIYIAIKLGPFNFGIWGFMLLLISYLSYFNFGIPNSLNILMVQNKTDRVRVKDVVANSLILTFGLSILIILVAGFNFFYGIELVAKYEIGNYFYVICLIGILFHFNSLMGTIYRVKNRLFELAVFQSVTPILIVFLIFFTREDLLLSSLLYLTLLGQVVSIIMFIAGRKIELGGRLSVISCKTVLKKGLYLFVHGTGFFLIVLSTRTLVSYFYDIEDFGYFTFSFTLANSILLLLQALAIIVLPKIVDRFNSNSEKEINETRTLILDNYVTLSYGLMFTALILFPVILNLIPKYQDTVKLLNFVAVTVLLQINSFGYNTHLMAQNKERILAGISLVSLAVHIGVSSILVLWLKVTYEYVIVSALISYFVYTYLSAINSINLISRPKQMFEVILDFFPLRLLIPYCIALISILSDISILIVAPLLLFILLNKDELRQISNTIRLIILRPEIIDVS